jgi:hypothetical protein
MICYSDQPSASTDLLREFLRSLFTPGTVLTSLGILLGLIYFSQRYLEEHMKRISYRKKTAALLRSHYLLEYYQHRLDHALKWLDRWMGSLDIRAGVFQSFNVCLAVSAGYTTLFFIAGWMFGGPGSVGDTQLLPSPGGVIQSLRGAALLVLSAAVGAGFIGGSAIDAACEAWLVRHLVWFLKFTGTRPAW